jgi:anti-sigma factor RsiW
MNCEDVQKKFPDFDPTERCAVEAHIAECSACRAAHLMYNRIDDVLRREPRWEPPVDFALRVAAQNVHMKQVRTFRSRFFELDRSAVTVAILVLAAFYLGLRTFQNLDLIAAVYVSLVRSASQAFTQNAITVVWICAGFCILLSGWFTRRTLTRF